MASVTYVTPDSVIGKVLIGSSIKVRLSNSEVISVIDATSPLAALTSLVIAAAGSNALAAPIVSLLSQVIIWNIKQVNRSHGNRGVTLMFRLGIGGAIIFTPFNVLGPDA